MRSVPRFQSITSFSQKLFGRTRLSALLALTLCAVFLTAQPGGAAPASLTPAQQTSSQWDALIARLSADGFQDAELRALFSRPNAAFDPSVMGAKMLELFRTKYGSVLTKKVQIRLEELGYKPGEIDGKVSKQTKRAIMGFQMVNALPMDGRPSDALLAKLLQTRERAPDNIVVPEPEPSREGPPVFRSVLTPERMAEARAFYKKYKPLLDDAYKAYGVPPEIAVGLLAVETRVGKFLGDKNALVTLASMAASTDPAFFTPYLATEEPSPEQLDWVATRSSQKAEWAYDELKALLQYCWTNKLDPLQTPSSIYGAIGVCQFMPSNVLKYAVDGNRDGVVDIFHVDDALYSLGNYLVHHGWKGDMSSAAKIRKALYNYNHSQIYVNTIMAVADDLRPPTSPAPVEKKPAAKQAVKKKGKKQKKS
jgi:membrane-bound lytic murein transglycosylase B